LITSQPNHVPGRAILALLLLLIATGNVFPAETDFRSVYWGMTRAQVIKTEQKEPLTSSDAVLTYRDTLTGIPVEAVYVFHPWQHYLTQGLYIVREDSTHSGDYVPDYRKLQSLLRRKFGDPVYETTPAGKRRKAPGRRKGIPQLTADSLAFVSRWQTGDTIITLELKHAAEAPPLTISYVSTNYLFTKRTP